MLVVLVGPLHFLGVSMKSGLEGRNNAGQVLYRQTRGRGVSMKSGLEGRNNTASTEILWSGAVMSQ